MTETLFGVAREIITPPAPMRLACTGDFDSIYRDVHDEVYVRTLVLRRGEHTVVWVSFDLLFHDRALNRDIQAYAQQRHGIDPELVIVAAVHNHNAPAVESYNPGRGEPAYESLLRERAMSSLDRAIAQLQPGDVSLARGDIDLNVNRRVVTDEGVTMAPNHEAARDTEMTVLQVHDRSGLLRVAMVTYACHPVFYPDRQVLTSEFPGRLCQLLEARHYGCTPMYFQGAAGDARPVATIVGDHFEPRDFGVVDAFAQDLADRVDALLEAPSEPIELAPRGIEFTVELPLDVRDRAEFEAQAANTALGAGHPNVTCGRIMAEHYDSQAHALPLHCSLVELAPGMVLATMGGEPCNDLKEIVREQVGGEVWFIGYTDCCAYIVSDRMVREGGYEAYSFWSFGNLGPFSPGVDDRVRAGFGQAWQQLSR
ncbi:hypothetical protein [Parenemella sanctibonifatiensis]|uniref:hypothetical protein n=1 Tax=Parenemella sanctibonifatiensis TaxID=2016505 RepID=UPI00117DDB7A|nr:hypothetical protein [Parenemella sanctibonifatiensis]